MLAFSKFNRRTFIQLTAGTKFKIGIIDSSNVGSAMGRHLQPRDQPL